jgi:glycosyltransferase involved in cell wall biosynthesis
MNILFVIPYYVPAYAFGGPLVAARNLAESLVARGHRVTVATTDACDENERLHTLHETINGVEVVRFRNVSRRLVKRYNLYLPLGFTKWIACNTQNFDRVFLHDFYTVLTFTAGRYCLRHQVPFYIHPHGVLCEVKIASRFTMIKKLLIAFSRNMMRCADGIIALTHQEQKDIDAIVRKHPSQTRIVHNGVEPDTFQNVEKMDVRRVFRCPGHVKMIYYIGRLQHIKGIDVSLRVLGRIADTIDFRFLVIGPDEGEQTELLRLARRCGIEKKVVFAGMLTGNERFSLMKSCDLFLFTSRSEGQPMTVVESGALGVPQVLSENCNVPEVEAFAAGSVFPLADIDGMSKRIVEILSDESLSRTLSRNGIRMVRACFSHEKNVDRLCAIAGID